MSKRVGTTDERNTLFSEDSKVMSRCRRCTKALALEGRQTHTDTLGIWRAPMPLCQQIGWVLTGPHFILAVHPRKPTEMKSRWGFPGGISGEEPACQCRKHKRHGLDPWVGKIPWRRKWQPTPVLVPGESRSQRSLAGYSP